jgi:hypothetical protein
MEEVTIADAKARLSALVERAAANLFALRGAESPSLG